MKRIVSIMVLCLSALFTAPLLAQTTTTGAVGGVISDPQGAVIPGATVVLRNVATDAKETTKTNSGGAYRFDLVPPGNYSLTVEQTGFEKAEAAVTVANSQVSAADVKMALGSEQTTIEVTAQAAMLQAENGNVATTISQTQVDEVPNSGNNLLFETKITPGFNTGFGIIGSTQYQVDGENFNDPYNNANNSGASNLTLGLNDVTDATITPNGYSGQYGGLLGTSVSFTTKSGGNRLHGDLTYYWTGRSLIANTFSHKEFASSSGITPRTFENANQWSGLLSGPITIPHLFNGHDRLFFLADAEGLRAILPGASTTVVVPSPNFQTYTLSKLATNGLSASIPFYKNLFAIYNAAATAHNAQNGNKTLTGATAISTGCIAASLSLADAAALGTAPGACSQYYASNASTYATEALEIFRVDANIGPNDKAFIRYEHDDGIQPTTIDPVSPLFNAISIQPQHDGQLNWTHTFGTRATNNFILGGLWYGALFDQPAELTAALAAFPAQMGFNDGGFTTLGGSDGSFPEGRNVSTMQFQDDVAWNFGAHTIKFGGKGYIIKENDYNYGSGTVPTISVATMGAFLNGGTDPSSPATNFSTLSQTFPTKKNHAMFWNQLAAYVEDDWKATPSLSLDFALRLEHQGNVQCLDNCVTQLSSGWNSLSHTVGIPYNQAYAFNQSVALPGLQETEWQPRFGFAYTTLHDTMVVRGGFGFFYDGLAGSVIEGIAKNPPAKPSFAPAGDNIANTQTSSNLFNDAQVDNATFGNALLNGGTLASITATEAALTPPIPFTPPNVYTAQPNFKMYYVEKFNLEVQKSLGQKTVVSFNYLGNHGVHRPYTNAGLNAWNNTAATGLNVIALPSAQPDARFGTVYYYASGGSTNYNALITSFTHKFTAGSVFTAGYTYGKTLSNTDTTFATSGATGTSDIGGVPDPYNPGRAYGPDPTDERHNLVINYVYKVPFKNIFYGGWQVSGDAFLYSGAPWTAIDTAATSAISSYKNGDYGASLLALQGPGKLHENGCNYGLDPCVPKPEFYLVAKANSPGNLASATPQPWTNTTTVDLNSPRGVFRGPMYITTDMQVTKEIPLHWEGGVFSASVQAFNVLNHLNFSKPTGSLSSGSFGEVTSVVNPTGIFSGVGGDDSPRIVQLKAKIIF